MKPTDRNPDFWKVSDLDDGGWDKFLAAAATFVIVLIALYLTYLTLWAAQ